MHDSEFIPRKTEYQYQNMIHTKEEEFFWTSTPPPPFKKKIFMDNVKLSIVIQFLKYIKVPDLLSFHFYHNSNLPAPR